jgi:hypothetical protein
MTNKNNQKPKYLNITELWATKLALLWCTLAIVIGVTSVEIVAGIAIPLMTIVMFIAGKWMIKFLLTIQKVNPFLDQKYFGYVVMFFWAAGIYGFLSFLIKGIFGQMDAEYGTFFMIVGSIFPLGVSLGASEMWQQNDE